jgi:hypothetical protein
MTINAPPGLFVLPEPPAALAVAAAAAPRPRPRAAPFVFCSSAACFTACSVSLTRAFRMVRMSCKQVGWPHAQRGHTVAEKRAFGSCRARRYVGHACSFAASVALLIKEHKALKHPFRHAMEWLVYLHSDVHICDG